LNKREKKDYLTDINFTLLFNIENRKFRITYRNSELIEIVEINPTANPVFQEVIIRDIENDTVSFYQRKIMRSLGNGVMMFIRKYNIVISELVYQYPFTWEELMFRSIQFGNSEFSSIGEAFSTVDFNMVSRIMNCFKKEKK
jgi:hypothetical protein